MKRILLPPLYTFRIIIIFTLFFSCSYNLGHRLGGPFFKDLPENTLEAHKRSMEKFINKRNYRYVELDIMETYDHEVMVFHDRKFKSILPDRGKNTAIFDSIVSESEFISRFNEIPVKRSDFAIRHFTTGEIKRLYIHAETYKVPHLKEILDVSAQYKIEKPIFIEIKNIYSNEAREKLISLIGNYSDQLDVNLIGFKRFFKKSFPEKDKWCGKFKENGFTFKSIGFHFDLCD